MRISEMVRKHPALGWVLFVGTMMATFAVGLFASSIMERRVESRVRFQQNVEIGEWESNPEKWRSNFPREYERWRETEDSTFKSKYAGSAMRDSLEEHPGMVVLWAGYAFSREYNQARGHFNAVKDVQNILRTAVPQPGTCWTCKSPDVPRLMNEMGIGEFYKSKWSDLGSKVKHPIGCLDCHDPKTMDLRISRPALVEAFERQGKDIRKATHQEMRQLVCAQCHVEYYFKDKTTFYLTFPWDKGMNVEDMIAYYDEPERFGGHIFKDFEHAISKAPMLKAQHPDYELFQQGIHAQRGVSCADCHMPYRSEGGIKVTDHKIESPLAKVDTTCQVCHGNATADLVRNVTDRQDKIETLRRRAEDILVHLHFEIKAARDKGANDEELQNVMMAVRHAQFRWDYAVASIGGAFHAPQESARILATAVDEASGARLEMARILAKHGILEPVEIPDVGSKAKAQQVIGLDMAKLNAEKREFVEKTVPEWSRAYDANPHATPAPQQ
jgi:nitrite reductase (cytochrome c-552)